MSKNVYIVLHDFTEIGETALDYALHIGKHVHTDIKLLHVVNDDSKVHNATTTLNEIIAKEKHQKVLFLVPLLKWETS